MLGGGCHSRILLACLFWDLEPRIVTKDMSHTTKCPSLCRLILLGTHSLYCTFFDFKFHRSSLLTELLQRTRPKPAPNVAVEVRMISISNPDESPVQFTQPLYTHDVRMLETLE